MTTMNGTATMNENSPVLRVENLSKTFGSRTLWKGHDFQASGGEMIALRGPSAVSYTHLTLPTIYSV